jgi:glycosyltransferase involved in cell wall biosynthesis
MTILTIITIVKDDLIGFKKTFDSVFSEINSDIEYLIIDSSELNDVKNLLQNVETTRFRYLYQKPKGIYPAMNLGLSEAKGEWIWFLNAGDSKFGLILLSEVIAILEQRQQADAVVFSVNHVIDDDLVWSTTIPEVSLINESLVIDCNHQGFIARKESMLVNGGFDTQYSYAADSKLMDLVIRNGVFLLDKRVIANFEIGGTSSVNFRKVIEEIAKHRKYQGIEVYLDSHSKVVYRNQLRLVLIRLISFLPKRLRPFVIVVRNYFRT